MFDTYVQRREDGGSKHISITEHRAPTDESVKLLKEMEEKAEARILDRMRVDDNSLNATWYVSPDKGSMHCVCHCKFSINGKEHNFKLHLDEMAPHRYDRLKAAQKIIERIQEEVVIAIVLPFFKQQKPLPLSL